MLGTRRWTGVGDEAVDRCWGRGGGQEDGVGVDEHSIYCSSGAEDGVERKAWAKLWGRGGGQEDGQVLRTGWAGRSIREGVVLVKVLRTRWEGKSGLGEGVVLDKKMFRNVDRRVDWNTGLRREDGRC